MRISAGRLGYSALVIFDMPTRMSANPSNSCRNGSHGTQFPCADSEAPGGISPPQGALDRAAPLQDRRYLGR
jgi:hypothetical protein